MPIKMPNNLPARQTLEREGVMVMSEADAIRQDIRPLRIGMLNLMPDKIRTETQFARLCGATPLQVEFTLLKMTGHTPKNTPADHMIAFYRDLSEVRDEKFDGMIVTGAPVELLEFEAVSYWPELVRFFDWTQSACAFDLLHLLGGAGGPLPPLRGRQASAEPQGVRRLPPQATSTRPRPICGAFRTISRYRCRAGPRCAAASCRPMPGSRC